MAIVQGTQEPVIVEEGSFEIGRFLRFPGEILVKSGDWVEPTTPIGSASAGAGRTKTLHLARELGVPADTIKRYLTKPIGSHFDAGESVARARKGLRAVTADTAEAGRLSDINEIAGTATLAPDAGTQELEALIFGEVASVIEGHGAMIKAGGSRIRGVMALGVDSTGPIRTAVDRHDRELTPDGITPDLRASLVLGGMTVSAAAIRKLAEVGARGVIVGSISESDVRRVAAASGSESPARVFWQSLATDGPLAPELDQSGFTIFVTEGFGRKPMAAAIFSFISEREGQTASVLIPGRERPFPAYPFLCFTSTSSSITAPGKPAAPADGVVARMTDPQHLGTVVTCRGEAFAHQHHADGRRRMVVDVEFPNRTRRVVQLCNLEILKRS
ncbi:MAG TPA: hypothetical protein VHV31_11405 [Nitrolancea sp.]|jgi:hypothetical protein|nr:hypothetical protein [Nitrolancea sp.]